MKFELGIEAKDTVTGFTGTITGFCTYLTGCDQYLLSPPVDKEGKHVDGRWYDVNRVEKVGDKMTIIDTTIDNGPGEQAPLY